VLSGTFDAVNGIARDRLARIHADGTLDTSFQSNFSNSGWYTGIFDVRLDGRLVVRGPLGVNFLTADGALDYRVNPGLGISGTNRHLLGAKSLSRGTLIYGNFDTYDNQSRRSLARLNDDGSVDQSFDARLAKTSWAWSPTEITVRAVETLPDGSFLAAGSFTEVQGKAVTGLARFTADGKLDESFRPFEPTLHEAAITADGLYRFRVAGEFNRPYLVEVSEDLKTWQPLRNLMLTASPFYFVDPRQTSGHSFYRIRTL
jgi:hypothetical protein